MPEMLPRIFFSYARSDAEFVLEVAKALRADGYVVWVDQLDIPKGARWDDEVEKALKDSNCLLLVLTQAAIQSRNVMDEVSFALGENRIVLPILLEPCEIPFRLRRLQHIDFTGDQDEAFEQLTAALDGLIANAMGSATQPMDASFVDSMASTGHGPDAPGTSSMDTEPRRKGSFRHMPRRQVMLWGGAALVVGAGSMAGLRWGVFETPAPPPTAPDPGPLAPASPSGVTEAQATAFVQSFLTAENNGNAAGLLRFYDDRVDYFNTMGADQDFIFKDKQAYYRRWPLVENRLIDGVRVVQTEDGSQARVTYAFTYRVHNPGRGEERAGTAHEELTLRAAGNALLIIAHRQKVSAAASDR